MLAELDILAGRLEAARARLLAEGLALAQAMPAPYAEARLLQVAGMLHTQQGEREAVRARLEVAQAICVRLGARRDLEQIALALDALFQDDGPGTVVSDVQRA